jgi:hypothetical protein
MSDSPYKHLTVKHLKLHCQTHKKNYNIKTNIHKLNRAELIQFMIEHKIPIQQLMATTPKTKEEKIIISNIDEIKPSQSSRKSIQIQRLKAITENIKQPTSQQPIIEKPLNEWQRELHKYKQEHAKNTQELNYLENYVGEPLLTNTKVKKIESQIRQKEKRNEIIKTEIKKLMSKKTDEPITKTSKYTIDELKHKISEKKQQQKSNENEQKILSVKIKDSKTDKEAQKIETCLLYTSDADDDTASV